MAVTITRALADDYFASGNHRYWRVWEALSDKDKDALVTQAIRTMSRTIGKSITDDVSNSADSLDYLRYDYAVYEQAIWSIPPHLIANGEFDAPHWIGIGQDGEVLSFPEEGSISPEALAWIDVRSGPTVSIGRG